MRGLSLINRSMLATSSALSLVLAIRPRPRTFPTSISAITPVGGVDSSPLQVAMVYDRCDVDPLIPLSPLPRACNAALVRLCPSTTAIAH